MDVQIANINIPTKHSHLITKGAEMTNEEIRKRFETFVGLGGKILYEECDVYKLQDLTRADERERVLTEIEQRLQSLIPLPNNEHGMKLGTIMLVIAKELNQLKTKSK